MTSDDPLSPPKRSESADIGLSVWSTSSKELVFVSRTVETGAGTPPTSRRNEILVPSNSVNPESAMSCAAAAERDSTG